MINAAIRKMLIGSGGKAAVLMYHRIAEPRFDPWQLCVRPQHFDAHLNVLQDYNVVPISTLINYISRGNIPTRTVCISFDDGYGDNLENAGPILTRYQMPACFFIPTYNLYERKSFWWDSLVAILFAAETLPSLVQMRYGENIFEFSFTDGQTELNYHIPTIGYKWPDEPPNSFCRLYIAIWQYLKSFPVNVIEALLRDLATNLNVDMQSMEVPLPMTISQLNELTVSNHFDIALHTHTHPELSGLDIESQFEEIDKNRQLLKTEFDRVIDIIAFPYGKYNDETGAACKRLSLDAAFTTKAGSISKTSDIFHLPRYQVNDWSGDYFQKKLKQWLT